MSVWTAVRLKSDPVLNTGLADRLCAEERARLDRIGHPNARRQSLCAHLLLRVLLCNEFGLNNRTLRVKPELNGKPCLHGYPGIAVSLSHTDGMVAAAVANVPVGIDVERIREVRPGIARRFFTRRERLYARETRDKRIFFTIWTCKEAAVKMSGETLVSRISMLDTLAPEWAGRFLTYEWDGYLLSCCCDDPPPTVPDFLDEAELEKRTCAMPPCEV